MCVLVVLCQEIPTTASCFASCTSRHHKMESVDFAGDTDSGIASEVQFVSSLPIAVADLPVSEQAKAASLVQLLDQDSHSRLLLELDVQLEKNRNRQAWMMTKQQL